jgi:hypothetical protein
VGHRHHRYVAVFHAIRESTYKANDLSIFNCHEASLGPRYELAKLCWIGDAMTPTACLEKKPRRFDVGRLHGTDFHP